MLIVKNMAVDDDTNPDIQDLITLIKTLSKDVAQANNQYAPPLTSTQKQKLLAATKSLTEKLESPDTVIWKVIFGVRSPCPYKNVFFFLRYDSLSNMLVFSATEEKNNFDPEAQCQIGTSTCISSISISNAIVRGVPSKWREHVCR